MFHLDAGDGLFVVGVGFVFSWFGCLLAVVVSLVFACAPYPPSYISYEDSSRSKMGT